MKRKTEKTQSSQDQKYLETTFDAARAAAIISSKGDSKTGDSKTSQEKEEIMT